MSSEAVDPGDWAETSKKLSQSTSFLIQVVFLRYFVTGQNANTLVKYQMYPQLISLQEDFQSS